jgi:hypothetical protein
MSDYLWDKTGEPDETVERLEGLLGTLRYRPRARGLPGDVKAAGAESGTGAAREPFRVNAPRARLPLRAAGLAVAAALLLALVAVAFVLLRSNSNGVGQRSARSSGESQHEAQTKGSATVDAPKSQEDASHQESVMVTPEPGEREKQAVVRNLPRERRSREQLTVAKRQPEQLPRATHDAVAVGDVVPMSARAPNREDTSLSRQIAAKEQLVYAFRLTSSKLREVQEKTQASGDPRRSFVEPNRDH